MPWLLGRVLSPHPPPRGVRTAGGEGGASARSSNDWGSLWLLNSLGREPSLGPRRASAPRGVRPSLRRRGSPSQQRCDPREVASPLWASVPSLPNKEHNRTGRVVWTESPAVCARACASKHACRCR